MNTRSSDADYYIIITNISYAYDLSLHTLLLASINSR